MLGSPSNSAEPSSSRASSQSPPFGYTMPSEASTTGRGYSSGGVLGALGSPSQHTPWLVEALSPPTRAAVGPRGPWPVGRFGLGIGVPGGPPPDRIVEIPNPHLERFIPQPTRDIWNAATLLPWILRRKLVGDESSDRAAEGQDGALSSQRSPQPPVTPPGNQPPGIFGPAILEKGRRQEESFDTEPQVSEQPDPNHRELTTVSPDSEEVGSTSDLFDPSLIGWRKKRKKTVRRGSSRGSFPRTSSSAGAGSRGPGGKGPSGNGGDDDDYCTSRRWEEESECNKRRWNEEYAHKDFSGACKERAKLRWDACNRNGGTPPPWEPKKWSLDPDEEVFINIGR